MRKFLQREIKNRSSLMRNNRKILQRQVLNPQFILLFTLHWASRHLFRGQKIHDVFQKPFSQNVTNIMTYHCQYFISILLPLRYYSDHVLLIIGERTLLQFSYLDLNSLQFSMTFIYLNFIEKTSDYLNLSKNIT